MVGNNLVIFSKRILKLSFILIHYLKLTLRTNVNSFYLIWAQLFERFKGIGLPFPLFSLLDISTLIANYAMKLR